MRKRLVLLLLLLPLGCSSTSPTRGLIAHLSAAVPDNYQPVTRSGAALLAARRIVRARNKAPTQYDQALADLILALVRDVERLNAALTPSKTPPLDPSPRPP